MELEITHRANLSTGELSLIELHSVVNIISLLTNNFAQIADVCGMPSAFSDAIDAYLRFSDYATKERTVDILDSIDSLERLVEDEIDEIVAKSPQIVSTEFFQTAIENIFSLINVLRIRGKEIFDRIANPHSWVYQNIRNLEKNLCEFLCAIEKNAKGRYRIVFDPRIKTANDYLVDIRLTSIDGSVLLIPAALPDILRDLLANARKYTPPGGLLRLNLTDDGKQIRCVVEDTGIGIPEEEISEVVKFGVRGSNVPHYQKQYGGGFGLTKALVVTQGVNGKMWINSAPNRGTTVAIEIPRPLPGESYLERAA